MADLNLDPYYFHDRKTKRLIGLLGKHAALLPLQLWTEHALSKPKSGRLTDLSPQEIESMVGWRGKPGEMVAAMKKVGFLDFDNGTYIIHNWEKRQGHLTALRQRAITAANARWAHLATEPNSKTQPCLSINQALPKHQSSNAPSYLTLPKLSLPNPPNPAAPSMAGVVGGVGGVGKSQGSGGVGGEVGTGPMAGTMARIGDDFTRQCEVQALLSQVGVSPDLQPEFYGRRDVTPARINREVASIRKDKTVEDVAAVLVHRLRQVEKRGKSR